MGWNPKSFLRQVWNQASDFDNDPLERFIRGQVGDAYNVLKPILFPKMPVMYDPKTGRPLEMHQGGAVNPATALLKLLAARQARAMHVMKGPEAWKTSDLDAMGYLFHGTDKWKEIMKAGYLDPNKARNYTQHYGKKVWTTSDPKRAIGHGGKGTDRRVIAIPRRADTLKGSSPIPSSGSRADHVLTYKKPLIIRDTPATRKIDPEGAKMAGEANRKARLARKLAESQLKSARRLRNYGGN